MIAAGGERRVPVQPVDRGSGNLLIPALVVRWQVHRKTFGNALYAMDPTDRDFGRVLLPIAFDVTA